MSDILLTNEILTHDYKRIYFLSILCYRNEVSERLYLVAWRVHTTDTERSSPVYLLLYFTKKVKSPCINAPDSQPLRAALFFLSHSFRYCVSQH